MKAPGALLALIAVLAMPAGAVAKPGYFVLPAHRQAEIRLRGSNGYRIEIQAAAARSKRRSQIFVSAKNGPASVTYIVPGSLAAGGSIDAHLPHVGRIAVEFVPLQVSRRRMADYCKGRPSTVERGYFRGTIELHGERGFTTVDRSSARGRVVQAPRHVCYYGSGTTESSHHDKSTPHHKATVTMLWATHEDPLLGFVATSDNLGFGVIEPTFIAMAIRLRGAMGVLSGVYVTGEIGDFVTPEPGKPKIAEVSPPAPFEGSATFKLTSKKASTWEGDLSVELPGWGRVQLAGPDFSSKVCEGQHCTPDTGSKKGGASDGSFFAQLVR